MQLGVETQGATQLAAAAAAVAPVVATVAGSNRAASLLKAQTPVGTEHREELPRLLKRIVLPHNGSTCCYLGPKGTAGLQ